jgi:hypothetical protein
MASETAVLTRQSSTMSMPGIFRLSDRLKAHAQDAAHRAEPLMCEDMRLAALSLRAMARSFHASDVLRIGE